MNSCEKTIVSVIDETLKPKRFHKKGRNWWCQNSEVIWLVNLQKSAYGYIYFLNLCVTLKALTDLKEPPLNQSHIATRLNSIITEEDRIKADKCFNCEEEIPNSHRENILRRLVEENVISFFECFSSQTSMAHQIFGSNKYNVVPKLLLKQFLLGEEREG